MEVFVKKIVSFSLVLYVLLITFSCVYPTSTEEDTTICNRRVVYNYVLNGDCDESYILITDTRYNIEYSLYPEQTYMTNYDDFKSIAVSIPAHHVLRVVDDNGVLRYNYNNNGNKTSEFNIYANLNDLLVPCNYNYYITLSLSPL